MREWSRRESGAQRASCTSEAEEAAEAAWERRTGAECGAVEGGDGGGAAEVGVGVRARGEGRDGERGARQVGSDDGEAKGAVERLTYFVEYAEARQRVCDARGALSENEGAEETTTEAHGLHHQCSEH